MVMTIGQVYKSIQKTLNSTLRQTIINNFTTVKQIEPYKSDDKLSISSIPHICLREEALALVSESVRTDRISSKTQAIFETGNAFQDIIRDSAIKDDNMLRGMFRCKVCDYVHGAVDGKYHINSKGAKEAIQQQRISRPKKCIIENCGHTEFEYIEETISNDFLNIEGHPDGILENKRYDHILEIKTANDRRFKEAKKQVFEAHVMQAMTYAWLMGKKGIVLLYFNKNNGDWFTRELNVDWSVIKEVINKIRMLRSICREYEETGSVSILPERICEKETEWKAYNCEMCNLCFSEDMQPPALD